MILILKVGVRSEDLEDSLETGSDLSDLSEEYPDYSHRNSENEHFPDSTDNIGDYADLIFKKVIKIYAEINRSSLKREFLDKNYIRVIRHGGIVCTKC